jgi:hypothetical protein
MLNADAARSTRRSVLSKAGVGLLAGAGAVAASTLTRGPAAQAATGTGVTDWINVVTGYGADPTGSADSTSAINNALAASGGLAMPVPVYLPAGTYTTSAPLVVPPAVTLIGDAANELQDTSAGPLFGSTIAPSSEWTPTSAYSTTSTVYPAVILLSNAPFTVPPASATAPANSSGDNTGQQVINININGAGLPTTYNGAPLAVSGIAGGSTTTAAAAVYNVLLQNVYIVDVTNHGIDGEGGGNTWYGDRVMCGGSGQNGFSFSFTDSTFTDCIAINNDNHGWYMYGAINTKFIGCRAEWNHQHGYWVSGNGDDTGGIQFVGCSTDRNYFNGMYIDATGNWPILLSGLMFRRDGRYSTTGGYAALQVNGATCPVIIDGMTVFPGYDDGGGSTFSPEYGISIVGTVTYVSATNAFLHAATAGLSGKLTNGRAVATRTGLWYDPSAITMVADTS